MFNKTNANQSGVDRLVGAKKKAGLERAKYALTRSVGQGQVNRQTPVRSRPRGPAKQVVVSYAVWSRRRLTPFLEQLVRQTWLTSCLKLGIAVPSCIRKTGYAILPSDIGRSSTFGRRLGRHARCSESPGANRSDMPDLAPISARRLSLGSPSPQLSHFETIGVAWFRASCCLQKRCDK